VQRGKKEVSREGKLSFSKTPNAVVASDDEASSQPSYIGPIAAMEFNRMKRELETCKKVRSFYS
jgi:phage terminase small subunit